MTQWDGNGNETSVADFGAVGHDQPILSRTTWALPSGDTSGWNYRATQVLTGYADSTGATIDTTQPVREIDYVYDAHGRLSVEWAPLSGGVALPGPSTGRAAPQPGAAVLSSPHLTLRTISYEGFGNVQTVGNQDNACAERIAYDSLFGQLPVAMTTYPNGCAAAGLTTNIVYDRRLDRVTSTMDPSGRVTALKYDELGRVTEVDRPSAGALGATTAVLYADYQDTAPLRRVHTRTGTGLDSGGIAAPAFVDHYRYVDGMGETRAILDAVDPASHQGQSWVISGVHTSYANGRTNASYRPQFASGPSAPGTLPPEATAPSSPSSFRAYDGLGRTTLSTDFAGQMSILTYHNAALSLTVQDPEQVSGGHQGSSTTVTRDGHWRVKTTDVHLSTGPQGASGDLVTTAAGYRATGEPATITQAFPGGSVVRQMSYDSLGRMVQNTEPNAGTWTYAYDAEGRVVGTSDARGCGQNIYYDLGGRIQARDYSPCDPSQPSYTHSGPPSGTFPYYGAEVSYAYDGQTGELTKLYDRGRADSYHYDHAGRLADIDRQLALPVKTKSGATAYGTRISTVLFDLYSVTGSVMRSRFTGSTLGSNVYEATTYTTDGEVAQITSPFGEVLQGQSFNADGSVQSQTFGDAARTGATFGYNNNGALASYSLVRGPGPWVQGYSPPAAGDPASFGDLTDVFIGRDMVGNPTSVSDTSTVAWPTGVRPRQLAYSYWDDYRLRTSAATPADAFVDPYLYERSTGSSLYPQPAAPSTGNRPASQSFQYDWRGNLSQSSDDANDFFDRSLGTVTGQSGSDKISLATAPSGGTTLTPQYDVAGNLTQLIVSTGMTPSVQFTYAWDEVGNLASASRQDATGVVTESYAYAAGGDRVRTGKTVAGQTLYTLNVFDSMVLKDSFIAAGCQICDYQDSPANEQLFLAGGLARVFSDTSGTMPHLSTGTGVHTFLSIGDARGSSAFVIDHDTGELVERTSYQPYGALDGDYRSARWHYSREDVKYTGHWDNAEVGLVYYGARYYSPQLGRFISPDPLTIHGLSGDPNPYEYAGSSPIGNVDLFGLDDAPTDGPTMNFGQTVDVSPTMIYPDMGLPFLGSYAGGDAGGSGAGSDTGSSTGWHGQGTDFDLGPPEDPPPTFGHAPIPWVDDSLASVDAAIWDMTLNALQDANKLAELVVLSGATGDYIRWSDWANLQGELHSLETGPRPSRAGGIAYVTASAAIAVGMVLGGDDDALLQVGAQRLPRDRYMWEGFGQLSHGGGISADTALEAGARWLGAGYKEIAPGVFRSSNGLRQFRMMTEDILGMYGPLGPHVHYESLSPLGRVIENNHVPLLPDAP